MRRCAEVSAAYCCRDMASTREWSRYRHGHCRRHPPASSAAPRPNNSICKADSTIPGPCLSPSERRPLVAVTGASGFIGRHLVAELLDAGFAVRALMRRQPDDPLVESADLEVISGGLEDAPALTRLVSGVDAVVHLAGVIKAGSRQAYLSVNRDGTERLAAQVRDAAPEAHFLHVSSLAAREPQLSDHAASKRAGEGAARSVLGDRVTVLRPAAVYGPGDRETLVFFQMASKRWVPVPAPTAARATVIHVHDLVRLMTLLLSQAPTAALLYAADARPQGYSWSEILRAAAHAVGNPRPKLVQAPAALLRTLTVSGDIASRLGNVTMLTSQKLRELRHLDWSIPETEWARPDGWQPQYDLAGGFDHAVSWYRQQGWLPTQGNRA